MPTAKPTPGSELLPPTNHAPLVMIDFHSQLAQGDALSGTGPAADDLVGRLFR